MKTSPYIYYDISQRNSDNTTYSNPMISLLSPPKHQLYIVSCSWMTTRIQTITIAMAVAAICRGRYLFERSTQLEHKKQPWPLCDPVRHQRRLASYLGIQHLLSITCLITALYFFSHLGLVILHLCSYTQLAERLRIYEFPVNDQAADPVPLLLGSFSSLQWQKCIYHFLNKFSSHYGVLIT